MWAISPGMSSLAQGLDLLWLWAIAVSSDRQRHKGKAPSSEQFSSFLSYPRFDKFLLPLGHPLSPLTPHTLLQPSFLHSPLPLVSGFRYTSDCLLWNTLGNLHVKLSTENKLICHVGMSKFFIVWKSLVDVIHMQIKLFILEHCLGNYAKLLHKISSPPCGVELSIACVNDASKVACTLSQDYLPLMKSLKKCTTDLPSWDILMAWVYQGIAKIALDIRSS